MAHTPGPHMIYPDTCDVCGKHSRLTHCDCCAIAYCRKCAATPDEGGNDCPNDDCNLAPCREAV